MPQQKCTYCFDGFVQQIGSQPCSRCIGTGRDIRDDLWGGFCPKCNGSGRETYSFRVVCPYCRGSTIHQY